MNSMKMFLLVFTMTASYAHAESYNSLDAVKLDQPKVGTSVTMNFLGCKIDSGEDFNLKCTFRTGTDDLYLYVTKQEAKSIVSSSRFQSIDCFITQVAESFATCTTRQDYLQKEIKRYKHNEELDRKWRGNGKKKGK